MKPTFIIAEAGVNHCGQADLALKMVDVAAECRADAIKFQTFSADKLVRKGAKKAAYQRAHTGEGDQLDMLKGLEMSEGLHVALMKRCKEKGIEFMSTPFDPDAAEFLVRLGMARFKVPSGEITNTPFLRQLAAYDLPLIVSTGMADLNEILCAQSIIDEVQPFDVASKAVFLHCTSNYPASPDDVNLRAMQAIASATHRAVGYSDHTLGIAVSTAAVALGAKVIEKHFTLDRALPGPDHSASLLPNELAALVDQIRVVERALGSTEKAPTASELPIRHLVRRSVTATARLVAGEVITPQKIALLRPGNGIAPAEFSKIIGLKAKRDIDAGTTLEWSDIE